MNTAALVAALALAHPSLAAPSLSFAFNSQLPPVARWDQAYSYTFSSDTYKSSTGEAVSYSSPNLPDWLTLNGRTLSGTPNNGSGDQTVTFELQAADSTGSTSSQCTLQITGDPAPSYNSGKLQDVLESSGEVANADSYVLTPGKSFDIKFPSDFFDMNGQTAIGHYAVTGDHAPLPIWLDFDGAAGTFSGVAPTVNSEIAQAQQFSIIYIVSTFAGFSSADANFNLVLGANVLSMNISHDVVNSTVGKPVSYDVPFSQIKLNGNEIQKANISSMSANIPGDAQSWLSFDASSGILSGTPPSSAAGSNYTVGMQMVDKYDDSVQWAVDVIVNDKDSETVFSTSSLPAANATRGKWFEYDLGKYVLNHDIKLSLASSASWLSLHEDNLTISGQVPGSFDSAVVNITASVLGKRGADSSEEETIRAAASSMSAHFSLYGVGKVVSSSSSRSSKTTSTTSSTKSSSSTRSHTHSSSFNTITATGSSSARRTTSPTSTSSPAATASPVGRNAKKNNNAVAIGCGVGIPVGIIAIVAAFVLFWCCRRKRKSAAAAAANEKPGGDVSVSPDGTQISAPRPSSKGMVMAPVFRADTASSGSSIYGDALDSGVPLEGDEGTVFGSPKKEPGNDTEDSNQTADTVWDSPQRASTLNFLAMDGDSSSGNSDGVLTMPLPADAQANVNMTPTERQDGSEIPPHREEDDVLGQIPRESWRHTNTGDRRWQDNRISQSSLASIVPTEPPTVQMASAEFDQAHKQPPLPEQGMQREYSSGVLHRIGSHTSSQYSGSTNRLSHAVTESQDLSDDSSGANFRPYRDAKGELHWRQEEDTTGKARLGDVGLDRKPSKAKTPKGDAGEFVFV